MSDPLGLASVFLTCADAGGFSAAGRRLGLSRSSVGKAIARLEAQLGVRLFHRTTRTQSLTEDGQVYYERAQRAVRELELAKTLLDTGRREPSGVLKVTAPVVLGRRCVAPVLLGLTAEHPALKLRMTLTDRPIDLVEEGYDLAIRVCAGTNAAGLMGRRVGRQEMTICASPAYLQRRGAPRARKDLVGHDLLLYGRAAGPLPWTLPDGEDLATEIPDSGRIWLDDLDALGDAAEMGLGLAWLPCWLVRGRIRSGALVQVLPDVPRRAFDIMALWPQAPSMPARLRAAVDRLAAELPAASR
ncbi:LysR family transcriptional regulator [Phenylobacterium sp.]|jgi:DNA-binding transcriptional LysR family regulator|uniref:LysR family transcriptional regulator n=1 Tax=Phenylobacterium sp. TaxID=1871053 RepID=UPI002E3343E7|nr:LysR family transcriptional regulator [Phenylobacterium sp.]HEX4708986.1 LysR family transcriptional regulator [Phenylobacterium sp.]